MISRAEVSLRGRVGALVQQSRNDPRQTTAAAREAFLARFEREVDPAGELPDAERARRAGAARKAHFARLAFASVRARRARTENGTAPSSHLEAAAGLEGNDDARVATAPS